METPEEAEDAQEYDPRNSDQRRYDAIGDQIREASLIAKETAELVRQFIAEGNRGQSQVVVHKTEGMGSIAIVAASICGLCVVFVVVLTIILSGAIRDLWAWKDVHSNDIAYLKAEVKKIGEKK